MKELVFPIELKGISFTKELEGFFYKAAKYAKFDKIYQITPANLVYTIISDEKTNIVVSTLEAMKIDINILYEMLKENRTEGYEKRTDTKEIIFSTELKDIIIASNKKFKQTKRQYGIVELLFALLKFKNSLTQTFNDNALEYFVFKQTFEEVSEFYDTMNPKDESDMEPEFSAAISSKNTSQTNVNTIADFTINLNAEYEKGNIQPCIGREREIQTLERILNRKNKRNAILVGKAGVGKTQILEGLVAKIVEKTCAPSLQNSIILSLNINDLEAGTIWRGQLEERIKNLLTFLDQNENVILFIDEIHSMIGVGRSNADLGNALKPYLSKGKVKVVGATTTEEFKQHIEQNKALTRRFFIQNVEELSAKDTLHILKNIKNIYEKTHDVIYNDNILDLIVDFCDNYLKNKTFPDKAIEILDDLGAEIKSKRNISKKIANLNKKLGDIKITKKYIIENKKYEESEKILIIEQGILEQLKNETKKDNEQNKQKITKSQFINYLNDVYKISNFIGNDYEAKIDFVETSIKTELFQQDHVVESVLNHLRTKKLFNDYSTPSVFLFSGESGVGKTFTGKLIAKHLYNNKIKIINCELYKEKHAISNFLGSPKGYVDSDKGSDFLEYVKYNPECTLLFDEIEKAHPDFYDVLLTLLDEGILTDKSGDVIDARRCLFILTTNLGSQLGDVTPIGFKAQTQSEKNNKTQFSLEKRFNPEFLNRLDEIIHFNKIDNFENILLDEFSKIKTLMAEKDVNVELTDETKQHILDSCKNNKGAIRELKRSIYKQIKQKIATTYRKEKALKI